MNTTTLRSVALLALGLAAATGCVRVHGERADTIKAPDTAAQVQAAARAYTQAVLGHDWGAVCAAETLGERFGDPVEVCVQGHTVPDPASPDDPRIGPLLAEFPLPVPARGRHPAGWAVGVRYDVTFPGRAPIVAHKSVRVVREGDRWAIDQHTDVGDAAGRSGAAPAVAALTGG